MYETELDSQLRGCVGGAVVVVGGISKHTRRDPLRISTLILRIRKTLVWMIDVFRTQVKKKKNETSQTQHNKDELDWG